MRLTVNGVAHDVDAPSDMPLLWVLRDLLGMTGTKYGCGEGMCRACTVLVSGRGVVSCQTPIEQVGGQNVVTIEGLASGDELHPVQEAFLAESALQCGYCTPGILLTAKALLDRTPRPTRAQIREALSGNLCRCTGYNKIVDAIAEAGRRMHPPKKPTPTRR